MAHSFLTIRILMEVLLLGPITTRVSSYYLLTPLVQLGTEPNTIFYSIPQILMGEMSQGSVIHGGVTHGGDDASKAFFAPISIEPRDGARSDHPPAHAQPSKSPMFLYNQNILNILSSKLPIIPTTIKNGAESLAAPPTEDNHIGVTEDPFITTLMNTVKRETEHLLHNFTEGPLPLEVSTEAVTTPGTIGTTIQNELEATPALTPRALAEAEAFVNLSSVIAELQRSLPSDSEGNAEEVTIATRTAETAVVTTTMETLAPEELENEILTDKATVATSVELEGVTAVTPPAAPLDNSMVTNDLEDGENSTETQSTEVREVIEPPPPHLTLLEVLTPKGKETANWSTVSLMAIDSSSKFQQVFVFNVEKLKIKLSNSTDLVSLWRQLVPSQGQGSITMTLPVVLEEPTTVSLSPSQVKETAQTNRFLPPSKNSAPSVLDFGQPTTSLPLTLPIDPRSIEVSVGPIDVML